MKKLSLLLIFISFLELSCSLVPEELTPMLGQWKTYNLTEGWGLDDIYFDRIKKIRIGDDEEIYYALCGEIIIGNTDHIVVKAAVLLNEDYYKREFPTSRYKYFMIINIVDTDKDRLNAVREYYFNMIDENNIIGRESGANFIFPEPTEWAGFRGNKVF